MKAMLLTTVADLGRTREPLTLADIPVPDPGPGEVLVRVSACGVCRTDLDVIEGRTPPSRSPLIPGHQVVGRVERSGPGADRFRTGDRVGIAWIHSACGICGHCRAGSENLCDDFQATGRDADGGYAEYTTVAERFAFSLPDAFTDVEAAPLLCAGAIGYRSLRLANMEDGDPLGLVGFGASGHLVLKMVRHRYPRSPVYVFSRTGGEREFAKGLGARWVGGVDEKPPVKLKCAIDTTPAWMPVVAALGNLEPGGRLVINTIRKEDADKDALRKLDYARDLWMEKEIKSVANIARRDVDEFLALAAEIGLTPVVQEFRLEDANTALRELKEQRIRGAKVLRMDR
jgi:propanol-preferring alcohol dehydrogenase